MQKDNALGSQFDLSFMRTVLDDMADGVVVANARGDLLYQNRAVLRMVGNTSKTIEEATSEERLNLFHPDGGRVAYDDLPLVKAIRGERVRNFRMVARNGDAADEIHVNVNGTPLFDAEGRVLGGVTVVRDITALRRVEVELQSTANQLAARSQTMDMVFNNISDGVVVADREGNFTMFNPSAERIVGLGATDTDPNDWADTYGLFYRDRVTKFPPEEVPLVRAIRGDPCDDVQLFLRNPMIPDGLYLSVSGRPLRNDNGEIVGGVVVFRDVTPHIVREETLLDAFEAGRLEILDTMLHNIGNAINSAVVGIDTLREELAQLRLLKRLQAVGDALESHRDDLDAWLANDPQGKQAIPFIAALAKDFARSNARLTQVAERIAARVAHVSDIIGAHRPVGRQDLPRKQIELRKTLEDTLNITRTSLEKRGVRASVDCRKAPKTIWVQESRFQQMMVNLLRNAIEAIDARQQAGGLDEPAAVKIEAYARNNRLVIDVMDNGIGVSPEQRRTIFAPGYTTKSGGSGLGLYSVANYIEGTGGVVTALSEGVGRGTTMRIELRRDSLTRGTAGRHGRSAGNGRPASPAEGGDER